MIFKETAVFTKRVRRLLSEEEYRLLQTRLLQDPDAGPVIPGSGGLRKIRWTAEGSGKRGGTRILYYWAVSDETILFLFAFAKNEREDLSPAQLRQLADLVRKEYP
jgi:mRNA-degrading endonuclease RelE of RelBE toxin-antitoxin system